MSYYTQPMADEYVDQQSARVYDSEYIPLNQSDIDDMYKEEQRLYEKNRYTWLKRRIVIALAVIGLIIGAVYLFIFIRCLLLSKRPQNRRLLQLPKPILNEKGQWVATQPGKIDGNALYDIPIVGKSLERLFGGQPASSDVTNQPPGSVVEDVSRVPNITEDQIVAFWNDLARNVNIHKLDTATAKDLLDYSPNAGFYPLPNAPRKIAALNMVNQKVPKDSLMIMVYDQNCKACIYAAGQMAMVSDSVITQKSNVNTSGEVAKKNMRQTVVSSKNTGVMRCAVLEVKDVPSDWIIGLRNHPNSQGTVPIFIYLYRSQSTSQYTATFIGNVPPSDIYNKFLLLNNTYHPKA